MGFRCSLYCVPKKTFDKYKDVDAETYTENFDEIYDALTNEQIRYDTLTDVFMGDDEEKFSTPFFTNVGEYDMYLGTVSKQQLLNIIEEVRVNHIIKWFDGRRIDGRDKLGEKWNDKEHPVFSPDIHSSLSDPWTYDDALLANQAEWNFKANRWKYSWKDKKTDKTHYLCINVDTDNKWQIGDGTTYEYSIFELVHILKIFDWENDMLIVIGG